MSDPSSPSPPLSQDQQLFHRQAVALSTGSSINPGVNVRQYTLHSSSSVLAFQVKELPDSFLVVLPSYLRATPEGEITAHLVTTPALCRFMKSNVVMTTLAEGLPLMYYLASIGKHTPQCPGYFDSSRLEKIAAALASLKETLNIGLVKEIGRALTRMEGPPPESRPADPEEEEIEAILRRSTPLSSKQRH